MLMAAPVMACGTSIIPAKSSGSKSQPKPHRAVAVGSPGGAAAATISSVRALVFGAIGSSARSPMTTGWICTRISRDPFFGIAGEEKEKNAWAVGGRIGYLVTPNVFTYWNGGYTETRFDQINLCRRCWRAPCSLLARIPITVGSLAAARRSGCRDSSDYPCRLVSSGAANTDTPASTAPTCPS